MLRNVLATLGGLVLGSVANMALVLLNSTVLYPMAPGADMNDPAALAAWVAGLPPGAFLVVLLAHNAQSFVGAAFASRFASTRGVVPAAVIGALTALGSAMNMASLPAPAWMWADVPLNLGAAGLGWWLARKRA